VREADEKQRQRLEVEVSRPLPGQSPSTLTSGPWSDEAMASSFMAFAGEFGGAKK
jgi:hypothetical protein